LARGISKLDDRWWLVMSTERATLEARVTALENAIKKVREWLIKKDTHGSRMQAQALKRALEGKTP